MKIKEVSARIILDSRKEETIEVSVNACRSSAPSGKSTGKYEKAPYKKSIKQDIDAIRKISNRIQNLPEIHYFGDLEKIEKLFRNKIGANTLFALEASILKALASEKKCELWQVINHKLKFNRKNAKFPRILSNTIGGGAHSHNKIKPDFQEFLVTCNKNPAFGFEVNKKCHEQAGMRLREIRLSLGENDEQAWQTDLDNEKILEMMNEIKKKVSANSMTNVEIGIDCAASQFYDAKSGEYIYKNRMKELTRDEQIDYIGRIARQYNLFYIEDPLDEEDFLGFSELCKRVNCLIVGDDLTATNLKRVKKAISMNSITGLIVKPNQIGSLIEVRKIMELCSKKCIKTIVSHRSGETGDSFIADLAFAMQADFIKIPVIGEERLVKVKRLMQIEGSLK
jgi:enolase